MRNIYLGSTAAIALTSVLLAFPAVAQQATTGAAPQESARLEEVVVTAQRRSENLQRTGLAVDVVQPQELVRQNITNPTQLGQIVPALDAQSGGGPNITYFLRGVGNFSTNALSDPALAVSYDGVYIGRPSSTTGFYYDLERIEVLKGPQGTLYGRNATAGALNINPVKPKLGQYGGHLIASVGNYDARSLQGAINLPLGEKSAFRFSSALVDRDGYMSDGTSDDVQRDFRAQFYTQLSDDLSLRISADYEHVGGKGVGTSYETLANYSFATRTYTYAPSGLDRSVGLLDPRAQALRKTRYSGLTGNFFAPLNTGNFMDNNGYGVHAELNWTLPQGTLTVVPAYRESELDNQFTVPAFVGRIEETDKQTSLEARFAGNRIGVFDYILGAFYFDEDITGDYEFAQTQLNAYQTFKLGTESYALFARSTAHLTDRFRLIGGVRYTNDKKSMNGRVETVLQQCRNVAAPPACPLAPFLPLTDTADQLSPIGAFASGFPAGQQVFVNGVATGAYNVRLGANIAAQPKADKVTYRLAAEYDLTSTSLFYASYETGFRSGGFALTVGKETFGPEQLKAMTLGLKNRLLDNRLQINFEAFNWKYQDQQVAHFGLDANGASSYFTENLGESTIRGFEVDSRFLAADHTLLTLNAQYLDAVFDDFRYRIAAPAATAPLPAIGCPYTPVAGNQLEINCSGKPAFQSPKWTLTFGIEQTIPLDGYNLVLTADTQYKGKRVVGFEYLDGQIGAEFWRSNLGATLSPESDKWSVGAFVNNVEGDRAAGFANFYSGANMVTMTSSAPRTYGLRVSANF